MPLNDRDAASATPPSPVREALRLLRPFWKLTLLTTAVGVAGGAATGVLLAKVNSGLQTTGPVSGAFLLEFAVLCLLVLAGRAIAGVGNSAIGQRLIARLRLDMTDRILDIPLAAVERLKPHKILAIINDDVDNVSAFTFNITGYCISLAVVIGAITYLATLSAWLFPAAILALGCGLWINFATRKRWNAHYAEVRAAQDVLQQQYRAVTDGGKELRLNQDRRTRIHDELLAGAAERIASLKIRAMRLYWLADAFGSTLFFLTIGILLALRSQIGIAPSAFTGFVVTLLFVKGPLDQVLSGLPSAALALVSLRRIGELNDLLAQEPAQQPAALRAPALRTPADFARIDLKGVHFRFPGDGGFQLGPIDLSIRRGETVFVVGENGAGKTILLKIICGLYQPVAGTLHIDDERIDAGGLGRYRALFSGVFSDYFLFEDLPHSDPAAIERARSFTERLGLGEKVDVSGGKFSTTDLSTGQRKRLALIQAYLEGRPIMVFDEWAADQDPNFRRVFYNEILPELKAQGRTLIVISHDDRFFHVADSLVTLEDGRLREVTSASVARSGAEALAAAPAFVTDIQSPP